LQLEYQQTQCQVLQQYYVAPLAVDGALRRLLYAELADLAGQ
jgi:hypothetical protein